MLKITVLSLITSLLLGCSFSKPPTQVVTEYKLKPITIPAELLKNCDITPPPSKKVYLSSDYQGKENTLAEYAVRLLTDLKVCNNQILSIKKYQEEQLLILEKNK
jgi:hypothetical protein